MSNLLLIGVEVNFCASTANIWQIVGYALLVFKIVIPIILIVFGMMDLGKAVVGSKDDDIKKAVKQLAMRAIAAVVIFFIPTLVSMILGLVSNFQSSGARDDFNVCRACITAPNGGNTDEDCPTYAEGAWNGEDYNEDNR